MRGDGTDGPFQRTNDGTQEPLDGIANLPGFRSHPPGSAARSAASSAFHRTTGSIYSKNSLEPRLLALAGVPASEKLFWLIALGGLVQTFPECATPT
ncbi:hypothetical protein ACFQUU_21570 [Herbaspirillum sp. GCM10030257]|uniref:hypothetical protein n=1 Tax=Herbaspirillum sp. GCM10030257 TaxID=3273393 RepID=UPI0036077341